MAAEAAKLLALAEAISDGREIDWAAAASSASAEDAELIQELRLLAGVAEVSRSQSSADGLQSAIDVEPPPALRSWGPLERLELLGTGSFGSVYRAWDPRLARHVALKLLHRHRARRDDTSAIVEEGRLLARVQHSHVITVYGADCIDGLVGISMEFIKGRTLEQALIDNGPFGAREAAAIGIDLCGALAAVHGQGLVHRDVKAQNVMREAGGRVVLMDFGAGQEFTSDLAAVSVGTPICMAPEQLSGAAADRRTDLYSLGVLLFRLVTATYPVLGSSASEVRKAHERGDRRRLRDLRPDLPLAFVNAIERALSPDPDARFQTAGEMEAALVASLDGRERAASTAAGVARTRTRTLIPIAAVFVVAIAAVLVTIGFRSGWFRSGGSGETQTIAVLPFKNLSGAGQDEYFVIGVTDLLLTRLSGFPSLRVLPPSSTSGLLAAAGDVRKAMATTSAGHYLEGSVERTGDRMRVSVRLIAAATGILVWAQSFDRPVSELFSVQGEISSSIAGAVTASVRGQPVLQAQNFYTTSPEAQDAYLRARYLLYRFNKSVLPEVRRELERAVAIDPQFALAHASLARAYLMLEAYGVSSFDEVGPLAVAAAQRAAQLAPASSDARIALAEVRFKCERNWSGADSEYRAAVRLAPNASTVRSPFSRFLSAAGRPEEALEQALAGAAADPLSAEMIASVGITHYYLRHYPDAIAAFTRAIEVNPRYGPGYFGRARARAAQREFEGAVQDVRQALSLSGDDRGYVAELARISAAAGWRSAAEQLLGELLDDAREGRPAAAPQDLAYVYLALGDRERALALLDEAFRSNFTRVLFLRVDPRFDAIRGDPRYNDLLVKLGGLPQAAR